MVIYQYVYSLILKRWNRSLRRFHPPQRDQAGVSETCMDVTSVRKVWEKEYESFGSK